MDEAAQKRAARRRAEAERWPVKRYALGGEPLVDDRDSITMDERLALMESLAVEMWAISGRDIPEYARHEAPGRLCRRDPT